MAGIRYVCLSDLHLGDEGSLLTNLKTASNEIDPASPSPALTALADCLRALLEENDTRPTLILNGDILELALCPMDQAVEVFEHFVALTMPEENPLFGEIIYLPGNHDHHLWETARETQYVNYFRNIPPGQDIEPPWHTTKIFMDMQGKDRLLSQFMDAIVQRFPHLRDFEVTAAYPNFGILSEDQSRTVIFHHGHFIESLYHLMSTLASELFTDHRMPEDVYTLEEENFAWIDFFWSTMGRSGEVGRDVERVYEMTQSEEGQEELIGIVARSIARNVNIPWVPERFEAPVIRALLERLVKRILGRHERQEGEEVLSEEASKGLWTYVEKMVRNQILTEHGKIPENGVTFVFGHTHKPFEEDMNFEGFGPWVNVLNTGGWVVGSQDPKTPSPVHGGAVVLVDADLNAANVRLYNEGRYEVYVSGSGHPGEAPNPLVERLSGMIDAQADPWRTFGRVAQRAVSVRASHRKAQVKRRER